ncbi:uncharacterized protein TA10970 [Theileria annulata]|uniref:AAA+ ATPase domain-containing protein n=1 Tax=Theileria annulata TaxID=5874 RepID=Q4U8F8_THEAN|nr:uncharacterized protein TA10970 [Theileria annulata]CAI76895.1 hypothetical protein TA10970 [Theileria annulata]|eukprot:XP_953520.1 hypothetical protein TA10970 [Theileria annulata]
MSISGLNIYSNISTDHWILDNYSNETQDKHYYESLPNLENYFHYYWTVNDSNKLKPKSKTKNFTDKLSESLSEDLIRVAVSLVSFIDDSSSSSFSTGFSYEFKILKNSIFKIIRDSMFLSFYNIQNDSKLLPHRCFTIYCNKDLNFYEFVYRLLKNTFYNTLNGKKEYVSDELSCIYTLDLSYYGGTFGPNFCYTNRCYLGTCCCRSCSKVIDCLDKNHKDPISSENLVKLLTNEQNSLAKFFIHNRKCSTLEYELLKITFNSLVLKDKIKEKFNLLLNDRNSSLKPIFTYCFVLIKNFEALFNCTLDTDKNTVNFASLALDLLSEYSEIWDTLDLPLLSFAFLKPCGPSFGKFNSSDFCSDYHVTDESFLQSYSYSPMEILANRFSNLATISDGLFDENSKLLYLQESVKKYSKGDPKEVSNDQFSREMIKIIRGYTLDELKVLNRMAYCESLKDKCTNFGENYQKYLEKATCLRQITDFSSTLGIYPELTKFSNTHNLCPLKKVNGQIICRTGLESLVLTEKTINELNSFFSEEICHFSKGNKRPSIGLVIKGDSGVGKTSLVHCMAQEMNSLLFFFNILSFLRPEVGLSEKILHSFLSKIWTHFSGSKQGPRRDLVKCVILLEGLEALKGEEGYLKRLISFICRELDEFKLRSTFALDYSVLFVTTCQEHSDLPSELLQEGRFSERLELATPEMDENLVRKCFELFLNLRCDIHEQMDKLIQHIKKKNYLPLLTPLKIAEISRRAALQASTDIMSRYKNSGDMEDFEKNLISLETIIAALDSTLS